MVPGFQIHAHGGYRNRYSTSSISHFHLTIFIIGDNENIPACLMLYKLNTRDSGPGGIIAKYRQSRRLYVGDLLAGDAVKPKVSHIMLHKRDYGTNGNNGINGKSPGLPFVPLFPFVP
jgi:hypothetical protein